MELPIAPQTYHDSPQTLIRAIRQADELLTGTSTEARDIEGARLYINPKLPGVHMANYAAQLYTPAGESPAIVLQRVMHEFAQAGQRCYWLQLAELDWQDDWIQAARTLGYQPGPRVAVMRLQLRQPAPHSCSFTDDPTWQVLPGRALGSALHKLYQQVAQLEHGCSASLATQLADWHIAHLDEPRCEPLVARYQGNILGYINVVSVGKVGIIDHVFTLPQYRRKGVAGALLDQALDLCARAQHGSVILEALLDGDALRLYQRMGFAVIGEHHRYERLGDILN